MAEEVLVKSASKSQGESKRAISSGRSFSFAVLEARGLMSFIRALDTAEEEFIR